TSLWQPVTAPAPAFASTATSAALATGDRVTVGPLTYVYLGSAATLNLTTQTYSNTTLWRLVSPAGDIVVSAVDAATITTTAVAASAAGSFGAGSFTFTGAGADAFNVILTKTKAYVDSSDLVAAGDIAVIAADKSTINAHVQTVSAAVSVGIVAGAVSIGVATAHHFVGYTSAAVAQPAQVRAYRTR